MKMEMGATMSAEQRMEMLEQRFALMEREVDCLFRLVRVQLEAAGLANRCQEIFSDFEETIVRRKALLASSDPDEDTDPGRPRPVR